MCRRSVVVLALAPVVALVLALAPPAGAQSTELSGSIDRGVTRSDAASCAGVMCGSGTLAGFGAFTFVYAPDSFTQVSRSCADVTGTLELTLAGSGDRLVMSTVTQACWAGNAANAPGSQHSWGNPLVDAGTWTAVSGTGVFAGATGDGTWSVHSAGSSIRGTIEGTLS